MNLIPEHAKKAIDLFLQQGDEDFALGPSAPEANAKNAYSLLLQQLKAEIVQAVKDKHAKQLSRSKKLQLKADGKGDRKQEQAINLVDEKFLRDLKAACEMKSSDFESRQQL